MLTFRKVNNVKRIKVLHNDILAANVKVFIDVCFFSIHLFSATIRVSRKPNAHAEQIAMLPAAAHLSEFC